MPSPFRPLAPRDGARLLAALAAGSLLGLRGPRIEPEVWAGVSQGLPLGLLSAVAALAALAALGATWRWGVAGLWPATVVLPALAAEAGVWAASQPQLRPLAGGFDALAVGLVWDSTVWVALAAAFVGVRPRRAAAMAGVVGLCHQAVAVGQQFLVFGAVLFPLVAGVELARGRPSGIVRVFAEHTLAWLVVMVSTGLAWSAVTLWTLAQAGGDWRVLFEGGGPSLVADTLFCLLRGGGLFLASRFVADDDGLTGSVAPPGPPQAPATPS